MAFSLHTHALIEPHMDPRHSQRCDMTLRLSCQDGVHMSWKLALETVEIPHGESCVSRVEPLTLLTSRALIRWHRIETKDGA